MVVIFQIWLELDVILMLFALTGCFRFHLVNGINQKTERVSVVSE
jgi:hypothetical protein